MEDNQSKYLLADSYECGNDDAVINSISFPDDVTDPRSDLYPWEAFNHCAENVRLRFGIILCMLRGPQSPFLFCEFYALAKCGFA